ncbi:fatty acid synthase-like [Vespa mandarinia]|uniref:fatty acid synthase-like n=1 Tax=Vespa mandarinia TaxID=7446 RepID=UPI001612A161|nr:fatty acid synthase-like [Vespa mandarinia]
MTIENLDDDAVVISGISGRFPGSDNINELMENLLKGVDCVSANHTRWKINNKKIPSRIGTISEITKLDHVFFGINTKLAQYVEPTARNLFEVTYEAICDAGINPTDIRNTNTAVFGALALSESDKTLFYEKLEQNGQNLLGCCRAMVSNRISFILGLTGTSCTIDSSCTSSALAIIKAYEAIKSGVCENAIIDAGILTLHPQTSYHMYQLGLLSEDGVNRSFDAKASGFTRSESIGVLFLQKAKNAKRIYVEIFNSIMMQSETIMRNNCFFATGEFQAQMMKQTLKQCNLKPSDITYIEADGTAIKEVDREELKAIDLVYAQDRSPSNPLLIGSIKSNIGHALCNNAINSIIKVIIAMETGVIPPNLHYDEPPEDAKCLRDGRVKVVTKPTPWKDDYAAVNNCSIAGTFSHIILKRYSKEKKKRELSPNAMPRLYVISARSKEMISLIFNSLKKNRSDNELGQLIYDVFNTPFHSSLFRGYTIFPELEKEEPEKAIEEIIPVPEKSYQIWFVFSGMGSQWTGMGKSLMKIPIFAQAIKKCDAILKPRGYDIERIICDNDPTIYDNIINSFLGIAAIQIGLVDILNAIDLKPNHIIGHSVGELGCAYADGCFTAEEMILSALSRGLASIESNLIHGTMAAVGLGYEQVRQLCPEDIDVACHNSSDSSTISGPTESIKAFVTELQEKGIFAKIVPTSNIAYHSRYIAAAGPKLLKYLQEVISHPKTRSERWISTSIPKNEWHLVKARLSSAEYHTNNLLSPVLFEEVLKMIPNNAITIEISPHGLLQAILRKSLSNSINLTLTRRNHKDNTYLLLTTLGKIYNFGYHIKVGMLYPRVPYPVSASTPSISSSFRWEHTVDWYTNFYTEVNMTNAEHTIKFNLMSTEYSYLKDFKIDGDVILPFSVYLKLILNTYLNFINKNDETNTIIVIENIQIYNKLLRMPLNNDVGLVIMIMIGSRNFEIKTMNKNIIASGTIRKIKTSMNEVLDINSVKKESEVLTTEDIYADLLVRGYEYGKHYSIIDGLSSSCSNGTLKCNNDWALLLEGLFQVHIFSSSNKNILMPHMIQKIVIDMNKFTKEINGHTLPIKYDKRINVINCPGIVVSGLKLEEVPLTNSSYKILANKVQFIPNIDNTNINMIDVCYMVLGLLLENMYENTTGKIIVIQEPKQDKDNILECLKNTLKTTKESFDIKYIAKENLMQTLDENFNLMIIDSTYFNDLRNTINNIGTESFLLTIIKTEDQDKMIATFTSIGLNLVLKKKIALDRTVLLLRKIENAKKPIVIKNQDNCIDHLKKSLRDSKYDRVIFLVNTITENNIFETLRILKQEPGYKKLQVLDLQNSKAPKFSLKDIFYQNQIKLNLYQNVLSSDNVWGTYRWMPLSERSTSLPRWRANIEKSGSLTLMEELSLKEKDKSIIQVKRAAFDLNIYEQWLNNEVNLDSQICITEYSGTDEKGHRVMGLLQNLTISNEICPDPDFTWTIPDSLSFEDAATMPQAYLAAFSILHKNSYYFTKIKTILIHIGASDIGQALINLSLWYNFDVYTTYETEAEKRVIQLSQPRLLDSHIIHINKYKIHFSYMKDKPIDLTVGSYSVLNQLESCLSIIEKHKTLILVFNSNRAFQKSFGTYALLNDIKIYSCCLQNLFSLPANKKRELADMMKTAIQAGALRPLISRRLHFPETKLERRIEVCERSGKVLVNLQELEKCSYFVPRLSFRNDKCYFIVGDFNIFGIAVIEWMIEQGVRKLLIASNKSIKDRKDRVLKWCENGATVIIREKVDMSKATNVDNLLKEVASLGQLEAIFDLQRTSMDSSASLPECSKITKILDEESRKLCPSNVKFFVFSSPNSNDDSSRDPIVEKICKQRMESGLHGLFILFSNSIKIERSEFINMFYKEISLFLQQLSNFLVAKVFLIDLRFISTRKHSVDDNEKYIITAVDTDEIIDNKIEKLSDENKRFFKYIYSSKNFNRENLETL